MRTWILCLLFAALETKAIAQRADTVTTKNRRDSLTRVSDSLKSKPFRPTAKVKRSNLRFQPDSTHSPHKAVMRSLILPGWGQVYNREWYYVPVYYTGFVLLGLAIEFNNRYYHKYLNEARLQQSGQPASAEFKNYTGGYQQFFDAAAANQRNFQLSILGVVGVWGINCVHAYISAKFIHSYSIDNNLSIRVTPDLIQQPVYALNYGTFTPGVRITMALK
ncbi:DUF5683 domain-containing protein [Mucilaginibacter sp. RS28]|uniref:DUF5683 domain-containing protein n=1 Tax=Mucilaginibacter straminoryzae TaxID=2932774 RepID=A0A9X1X841_9SPHI|nr:DUF5683 domain-containing protein [Mucilaginibacter straminoryzae]MCJ8211900.1 DUF5683 domain-containing protein [Mucilaginibacter straminoryzae]